MAGWRAGCSRRRRRPRTARRRCSPASGRAPSRGCWRAWRAARPRMRPQQALSNPYKPLTLVIPPLRKAAQDQLSKRAKGRLAKGRLPAGGGRCGGAGTGTQRRSASCASCARSLLSGAGSCQGFQPQAGVGGEAGRRWPCSEPGQCGSAAKDRVLARWCFRDNFANACTPTLGLGKFPR